MKDKLKKKLLCLKSTLNYGETCLKTLRDNPTTHPNEMISLMLTCASNRGAISILEEILEEIN